MDRSAVKAALAAQHIETPSWAYGNSGTRFKVFPQAGVPRDPYEKVTDAAVVHRFTGVAPSVAIHIPWDKVEDYANLSRHAQNEGIAIGAINPNLFQEEDYKLGSLCNPDPTIRRKATDHVLECIEIGEATGSTLLSLWLPDGTNYPGQDDIRDRQRRLSEALREIYDRLPDTQRLLIEYKFFEPYFYTMDLPDWGTSYLHCLKLGERAQVLVDTGHHAPGTNIEFIVGQLLEEKRLGGFHFNSRNYADDDLMVGAADPFQLFRLMTEIVLGGALTDGPDHQVAFMLDQCHNIEPKIPALIRSVMNVQEATAKALLIDVDVLRTAQASGDVLGANAAFMDAFNTDVRPLLAEVREDLGVDPDPINAYYQSGYAEKIVVDRKDGAGAGWGG